MARDEYSDVIEDVPRGNNFRIRREFTISELAGAVGIAKARLLIKAAKTDTDEQALVTLNITEAQTAAGRILRDGTAVDRIAEVSFELLPLHTNAVPAGTPAYWSIKVEDDVGGEYTPFMGTIATIEDVIQGAL